MKKMDNNKNFAKQKILQASDITDVDLEIPDRREVNNRLIGMLQPPESPSRLLVTAAAENRGETTQIMRLNSIYLLAAVLAVMIFTTLFLFFYERVTVQQTNGQSTIIMTVDELTVDELRNKVPDIALPSVSEYTFTSILLYKFIGDPAPVFAEIMMEQSADDHEDEIILRVGFVENIVASFYRQFDDLKETSEINGTVITFDVNDEENCAFAKFYLQPYEYYLQYNSLFPDGILEIIETMI